jgi:hypothetical protein
MDQNPREQKTDGPATLLLLMIYDTLKSVFLVNSSLGLMGVVLAPPQSLLSLARQFFSLINEATSGLSSEVSNKISNVNADSMLSGLCRVSRFNN